MKPGPAARKIMFARELAQRTDAARELGRELGMSIHVRGDQYWVLGRCAPDLGAVRRLVARIKSNKPDAEPS